MIQSLIVDINNITNDEKEKLWDFVGVYSDEEIVDCSINEGVQHCNDYKLQVKNSYSYYAQQYNELERNFRKQTVDAFEELLDKNRVKNGTWGNVENRKLYADWLFIKLGYTSMEDWYEITNNIIYKYNGCGLLTRYYNDSSIQFLQDIYPEIEWIPWKMKSTKKNYWNDTKHHKLYAEWLFKKLGYKTMEDWYKISTNIIAQNYGGGLLASKYKNSVIQFLQAIYPEIEWVPWKFDKAPNAYWNDTKNHKIYMEWLFNKLDYKTMEDWYKITADIINNNYGNRLLKYYNSSTIHLLESIYPEIEWVPWKLKSTPKNHWKDTKHHKLYAEWLFKKLGYKTMEDWYKISTNIIAQNYGGGLLASKYKNSVIQFLQAIYPEIEWVPWKFDKAPNAYWNDTKNHKIYMEWLFNKLDYKTMEDWYKITADTIKSNYGGTLFGVYYSSSIHKMLTTIYPDYNWDVSKFKKSYSIGQIEWLNYLCVNTPDITHMINNDEGEFNIPNSNYRADGYSKINNTIYEYHGDFWHGNPKIYNSDDINPITKTTYKELYDKTMQKQSFCEDNHYKYVSIWESEWLRGKIALIKMQRKYKSSQN